LWMLERVLLLSKNNNNNKSRRPTGVDDVGGGGMAVRRRRRRLTVQSSPSSSTRRSQFGRVESTHQQFELNQKIVQLGRSNDWEAILALFRQEEDPEEEEPEPVVVNFDDNSDSSARLPPLPPRTTRTAIVSKNQQKVAFGLINLSTALSQLTKVIPALQRDRRHHPALHRIIDGIADHVDQHNHVNDDHNNRNKAAGIINARQYATIVHAIAKMHGRINTSNTSARRILQRLTDATFCQDFLERATPQDVSMVAWSLAKLGRRQLWSTLLAQMDEPVLSRLVFYGTTPQAVANTAWACAKLGQSAPGLFAALDRRGDWLVANGVPAHIATTAWACATLDHPAPNLFAALEKRADWFVTHGQAQEIATTAWAGFRLGHVLPAVVAAIEQRRDDLLVTRTRHGHGNNDNDNNNNNSNATARTTTTVTLRTSRGVPLAPSMIRQPPRTRQRNSSIAR
jgi:hypothetical protein